MSYANRILGSIPYGTLIGAPMTAAVEAQALAAQSSIDFIRTVGFENMDDSAEWGATRHVNFTYTVNDAETSTDRTADIRVPLLTIVPIPYLRIDDMTIDFTSKITEELVRTKKRDTSVDADASLNIKYSNFLSPVKVGFKASLSTKHSSSSATSNRYKTEHTININVRAVQDDIPNGMSRVLDMLETSIAEPKPSSP
ncbi:DUF2589 domain-containing protein [Microbulbifer sediminum]|uniref:DUF2589 domain-containing protein n=1 Tax=Microbulbifer sediminum TaxID=2904250 RepID=UPI001F370711|nr:DUF2589 domain-containing protein [Microbulbifer sediminum]